MKWTLKVSLFTVTGLAMVFPVLANQSTVAPTGETGYSEPDNFGVTERQDPNQVKANNTALNVRDRNQNSVTPLDQGNSQADVDATAAIRKDIMARDGMSMDAKNIKIITQNGKITLRGPVKTVEEKNFIAETARGRFSPQNVDDQLEVIGNS